VSGTNIYAATYDGLSISTNSGTSFTNRTTADGLGSNVVFGVAVSGTNIYAATSGGLSICTLPPTPTPTPFVVLHFVTLDPNGGSCMMNGIATTTSARTPFLGYSYIPGAEECTRPGFTFLGWATTNNPNTPISLPLLRGWDDGIWRYFIANSYDLIAVWKPST
jgi:hypothetical protein